MTPRIDVSYQDQVYANADNEPTNLIDGGPARQCAFHVGPGDDTWPVALEATNLADEYYYVTVFDLSVPRATSTANRGGRVSAR